MSLLRSHTMFEPDIEFDVFFVFVGAWVKSDNFMGRYEYVEKNIYTGNNKQWTVNWSEKVPFIHSAA
jgi:hypothetical protein